MAEPLAVQFSMCRSPTREAICAAAAAQLAPVEVFAPLLEQVTRSAGPEAHRALCAAVARQALLGLSDLSHLVGGFEYD